MNEEKEIRFEAPEKPIIEDTKEVKIDCSEFDEPERAEALIKNLSLDIGDTLQEDGGENYTINPRMVLEGDNQEKYKREIEEVKIILTEKEKKAISLYYKEKKEDKKTRDKLYYGITKRVEKIFNWDDENKKHIPKKNSKRSLEICKSLSWIHNNNNLSGFNNIIYHILSKENGDWVNCYKCAWFNKSIPNIQEWRKVNDGEYRVLTDSEADYKARDYLEDDEYLWKQAVESGNTTEGFNDWIDSVLNMDGRGSILGGYDGCEESEEINGTDYYIYRTN